MTNNPNDSAAVLVAPFSRLTPCGPYCSINDNWQSIPRGVHASVMDTDKTADYWVCATGEASDGFPEEFTYQLIIGVDVGQLLT